MCSLIEDWVLIAASAFSLLWYIVLVKVYKEENLASHRFKVGEGKEYFNSFFSGNCGFSSLILHQNLINGSFLMESTRTRSVDFSYSVILKSFGCILGGSFIYTWFYIIMHWSFGKCWFTEIMLSFQCDTFKLHNISTHYVASGKLSTCERMRVKTFNALVLLWKSFWPCRQTPETVLKTSRDPWTTENHILRQIG